MFWGAWGIFQGSVEVFNESKVCPHFSESVDSNARWTADALAPSHQEWTVQIGYERFLAPEVVWEWCPFRSGSDCGVFFGSDWMFRNWKLASMVRKWVISPTYKLGILRL